MSVLVGCIERLEGFGRAGTIPTRLNNPGDLIFKGQPGAVGEVIVGRDGVVRCYANFANLDLGLHALEAQIRLDAARGETIAVFSSRYAPAADGNNQTAYLAALLKALGETDSSKLLSAVIA